MSKKKEPTKEATDHAPELGGDPTVEEVYAADDPKAQEVNDLLKKNIEGCEGFTVEAAGEPYSDEEVAEMAAEPHKVKDPAWDSVTPEKLGVASEGTEVELDPHTGLPIADEYNPIVREMMIGTTGKANYMVVGQKTCPEGLLKVGAKLEFRPYYARTVERITTIRIMRNTSPGDESECDFPLGLQARVAEDWPNFPANEADESRVRHEAREEYSINESLRTVVVDAFNIYCKIMHSLTGLRMKQPPVEVFKYYIELAIKKGFKYNAADLAADFAAIEAQGYDAELAPTSKRALKEQPADETESEAIDPEDENF